MAAKQQHHDGTLPAGDSAGMFADLPEILTHEQLFNACLDSLREALRRISPTRDPRLWAAAHLKLGSALRVQAQRADGREQAEHYLEAIEAFESAVAVYCRSALAEQRPVAILPGQVAANDDPVDLVVAAGSSPAREGVALLRSATEGLLAEHALLDRKTHLRSWAINVSNRGCALVLLGRRLMDGDGPSHLEDAVDAFREVLKEPGLREMLPEYASLHVNLADALQALSERALPAERLQFIERAVDSLAVALSVVAPQNLRWMVEAQRSGAF